MVSVRQKKNLSQLMSLFMSFAHEKHVSNLSLSGIGFTRSSKVKSFKHIKQMFSGDLISFFLRGLALEIEPETKTFVLLISTQITYLYLTFVLD